MRPYLLIFTFSISCLVSFSQSAIYFNDTNTQLIIPNGGEILNHKTNWTIEFWLQSQNNTNAIISIGDHNGLKLNSDNSLVFSTPTGTIQTPSMAWPTDNRPHHLAIVSSENNNAMVYIDGIATESDLDNSLQGFTNLENSDIILGSSPFTIDDLRIWSSARSGEQISENMFACLNGDETELQILYHFEEVKSLEQIINLGSAGEVYNGSLTGMDANTSRVPGWNFCANPCNLMDQEISISIGCDNNYVHLNSSQEGVLYTLRDDSYNTTIGNSLIGTGNTISFPTGNISKPTSFNIYAQYSNESGNILLAEGIENQYVQLDGDPLANATSFTIELWIKPNFLIGENIRFVPLLGYQESDFRIFLYSNGIIAFRDINNEIIMACDNGTYPIDNEWHHIALVYDEKLPSGKHSAIYLDGYKVSLENQGNLPAPEPFSNRNMRLGNYKKLIAVDEVNYDGLMDEFRIWNIPLNQAEIQGNMRKDLTGNENGLITLLNFNEGSGSMAYDHTGNGFDGTLIACSEDNWQTHQQAACSLELSKIVHINPSGDDDLDKDGYSVCDGDCDDNNALVNPGIKNDVAGSGIDANCDGNYLWYEDSDGDGFGSNYTLISTNSKPSNREAYTNGDCDDGNASINPGQVDTPASGQDINCDGLYAWFEDKDHDGFGSKTISLIGNSSPMEGYVTNSADCDDSDSNIFPGATSDIAGSGKDQNCDGKYMWYIDADKDGYGGNSTISSSNSKVEEGEADQNTDCDDNNSAIYPGAEEVAGSGLDSNCDNQYTWYKDEDNDGFGRNTTITSSNLKPDTGEANNNMDCDDDDASIFPNAENEITASGIDQNCDGLFIWYEDLDNDGFGGSNPTLSLNPQPGDYEADNNWDCIDTDKRIHPEANDIPDDEIDQNCDGYDELSSVEDVFFLYPNPTYGETYIDIGIDKLRKDKILLEFYNFSGQLFRTDNLEIGETTIDLTQLKEGIYVIKVRINDFSEMIRLVKK